MKLKHQFPFYFSFTYLKTETPVFNVPSNMQLFKVDVVFWYYFLGIKVVVKQQRNKLNINVKVKNT
jgi:hypothetical protein